ncbi:SgcJ/EcaC family oxidoreductase [Marivirga harenae]|uniref:SgcJ/EcaC family oxidoreductase n=1 Tax=Marivirga harenae TaxID=2010992 RepID=UPI0026E089A4|nr:SgcJ/EcaC family oxidoreductase [Marivirga harenae]WKV13365.1 SgcJ/EcaC family oxidoreductase [Marivirga harenae]|tara:strand:- start:196055 stop:196534 length:480 start_codon:yes stop_codon:yes gene_type:complete
MANSSKIRIFEPEEIPKTFVKAWNLKDAKMLASIFDEDAEFINVTGLWWHDREFIFKAHDYGLIVIFKGSALSLRKLKVKYLSDKIAVVNARIHLEGQTDIEDKKAKARNTIFTFVLHQSEDGKWSCASAQNTDIVPGKETHFIDEGGNMEAVDYQAST